LRKSLTSSRLPLLMNHWIADQCWYTLCMRIKSSPLVLDSGLSPWEQLFVRENPTTNVVVLVSGLSEWRCLRREFEIQDTVIWCSSLHIYKMSRYRSTLMSLEVVVCMRKVHIIDPQLSRTAACVPRRLNRDQSAATSRES
jgi:hypothetical protein